MVRVEPPLDRQAVIVRGLGVILLASFLFGAMAVCVRVAARDLAASQIAFVRFAGSLLVLLLLRRGRRLRPQAAALSRVLLRGLLGASAILLYYRGIQGAGAGFATLLQCTYPVFTALFATTLLGERFAAVLGVALALNLIGVVIIIGPSAEISPGVLAGGLSALGAAVLSGGAVATARQLRGTESAWLITTYFMAVGVACTAPALLLDAPALSPGLLLALTGVVITSVCGQILLHYGLGFTAATQASLAATTSVVTAAALEALWLGEHLSRHTLLGAAFMLAAIALAAGRQ
ncbi:MAG: DMT family transporter [Deltaproteobacteria bacterium]|nr:DMT family transporter [Deltaproteobacteria bacterium]